MCCSVFACHFCDDGFLCVCVFPLYGKKTKKQRQKPTYICLQAGHSVVLTDSELTWLCLRGCRLAKKQRMNRILRSEGDV